MSLLSVCLAMVLSYSLIDMADLLFGYAFSFTKDRIEGKMNISKGWHSPVVGLNPIIDYFIAELLFFFPFLLFVSNVNLSPKSIKKQWTNIWEATSDLFLSCILEIYQFLIQLFIVLISFFLCFIVTMTFQPILSLAFFSCAVSISTETHLPEKLNFLYYF